MKKLRGIFDVKCILPVCCAPNVVTEGFRVCCNGIQRYGLSGQLCFQNRVELKKGFVVLRRQRSAFTVADTVVLLDFKDLLRFRNNKLPHLYGHERLHHLREQERYLLLLSEPSVEHVLDLCHVIPGVGCIDL